MAEFRKECAFPVRLWKKDPDVEAMRKNYRAKLAEMGGGSGSGSGITKLPPATPQRRQLTQRSMSIDRVPPALRRGRTGSLSRDSSRSSSRASQNSAGGGVKLPTLSK